MARTALPVNKTLFEQAVQEVEGHGPLATQQALFIAVADKYNTLDTGCKISAPVAKLRIEGWTIPIKTAKARNFTKTKKTDSIVPDPVPAKKSEPKVSTDEPKVSVEIQRRRMASGSCGCGHLNIVAPAWACPVKLTGTDRETVAVWAGKVVDAGHKIARHYSPTALKYYVRHFYDLESEDWRTVVGHLASISDMGTVPCQTGDYDEDEEFEEDTHDEAEQDDSADLEEEPLD